MREDAIVKLGGLIVGLVGCAVASVALAFRLWPWVVNFDPGFVFNQEPAPTGAPLTPRVTILLVDGLRLDASRRMEALNALRSQGADIEAQVGLPSFSRPGRATLAVGAPPSIHGVTTNRQKRAVAIDNLIRRVGVMGGTCRVAGSKIWLSLFGGDIARCGSFLQGESKEGPGTFVTNIGGVRTSEKKGIAFVLEQAATLRIVDLLSTDFAAHEYGGASPEYRAEVEGADQNLRELVGHLDLSKETLVVTADHGHRDAGGHGGEEPEVLAIPIVMAGLGIRPSSRAEAKQADIAPTVAALLGAALPAGSSGRPIDSILLADESKLAFLRGASAAQEKGFNEAVANRLGIPAGPRESRHWRDLEHAYHDAELMRRNPAAIVLTLLVLAGVVVAIHGARPGAPGLIAGVLAGVLMCLGPIRWLLPGMSFSVINYDETLVFFFLRIMGMAAAATMVCIGAALIAGGRSGKSRTAVSVACLAASVGLLASAALLLATVAAWLHNGLLSPLTFPGPDRMVESFALTLSVASVSVTSLLATLILWLISLRTA